MKVVKEYYLLTKIDGSEIIKNYGKKNNNEMLKTFIINMKEIKKIPMIYPIK